MTPWWWLPQPPHQHPEPLPWATAHGVGMGSNRATMMMGWQQKDAATAGRGGTMRTTQKEGLGDIIDVSWATGKFYFFFFLFSFFLVTSDIFLGTNLTIDNDETMTQHWPGRGKGGSEWDGHNAKPKKGPGDVNNVSWAIGKFFFSLFLSPFN